MTDLEILDNVKAALGDMILEIANPDRRRIFVTIEAKALIGAMTALHRKMGYTYVATISGVDAGDAYEIVYHLGDAHGNLNVRTRILKADPHVASITPVLPGAILYERELQDMFGLTVDNLPDPRPLVMPDDWPAGNYPLRKDWTYTRPEEIIPGGKK